MAMRESVVIRVVEETEGTAGEEDAGTGEGAGRQLKELSSKVQSAATTWKHL